MFYLGLCKKFLQACDLFFLLRNYLLIKGVSVLYFQIQLRVFLDWFF